MKEQTLYNTEEVKARMPALTAATVYGMLNKLRVAHEMKFGRGTMKLYAAADVQLMFEAYDKKHPQTKPGVAVVTTGLEAKIVGFSISLDNMRAEAEEDHKALVELMTKQNAILASMIDKQGQMLSKLTSELGVKA